MIAGLYLLKMKIFLQSNVLINRAADHLASGDEEQIKYQMWFKSSGSILQYDTCLLPDKSF